MTHFDLPSALDASDITFVQATANLTYEDDLGATEHRHHKFGTPSQDFSTEFTHIYLRKYLQGVTLEEALAKYNPKGDDEVTLLLVKLITQP